MQADITSSSLLYDSSTPLSFWGLRFFFLILLCQIARSIPSLFVDRHGWSHRWTGGFHLLLLLTGAIYRPDDKNYYYFVYDVCLGCSGMLLTYTAARDFPHRTIRNGPGQSGTLSEKATVTYDEMIEHLFYQFLNLWQALYLHCVPHISHNIWIRWLALLVVTAPWWCRHWFPVHSFQQNWQTTPPPPRRISPPHYQLETTILLYKIKKGQYLFYKHVVLHGLNLTQCLAPTSCLLVNTPHWRIFWLCLNTAYVMEFFLQSLVKRRVIHQSTMLMLNQWLMFVSSVASLRAVLTIVRWDLCAASLFLQLTHRHHDVFNTMLIASAAIGMSQIRINR